MLGGRQVAGVGFGSTPLRAAPARVQRAASSTETSPSKPKAFMRYQTRVAHMTFDEL